MNRALPTAALLLVVVAAYGEDPPAGKAPAPAAGKHECKIAPEAQAAFDRMAKAVNGPLQRGMKDASGTLATELGGKPFTMKFAVKAPDTVSVEPETKLEGQGQMMGRNFGRQAQNLLRLAFGIVKSADEELDAQIVKKDGKDVLSQTVYKDGAEQSHTEFTLDANGLPVSATMRRQPMGGRGPGGGSGGGGAQQGGPPAPVETTYTWTKSGESYRLDKIETTPPMGGKNTTTLTWADAGGYSLPISWKTENARFSGEFRIAELTVDGKKVELAKAPAPKEPAPAEKGEEKK